MRTLNMHKIITVDNVNINKKDAISMAREYFEKEHKAVEVSNMLGDPIFFINKYGKEYRY